VTYLTELTEKVDRVDRNPKPCERADLFDRTERIGYLARPGAYCPSCHHRLSGTLNSTAWLKLGLDGVFMIPFIEVSAELGRVVIAVTRAGPFRTCSLEKIEAREVPEHRT